MKRQLLGVFAVDAGLILIGAAEAFRDDPEIGQKNPLANWDAVCRPLAGRVLSHTLGASGVVYRTGGDGGLFTVLTEHDDTGRPVQLVIELA